MRSLAEARTKRLRALELVGQGMSYDEIAQAVGYSHRGSAHKAVFKALDEREVQGVDSLRQMEVDRLDTLQQGLWGRAVEGDLAAVNAVLKIIDLRCRLLGLYPSKTRWAKNDGPAFLVVGPFEGNPEETTMADVEQRWAQIAACSPTKVE